MPGLGMVSVFAAAVRRTELVEGHPAWKSDSVTAMICRDLRTVPAVALSSELMFRPVRRLANDAPNGVPLEDAVAAARLANPRIDDSPAAFADYLRTLPPPNRLFAAVDRNGAVRATSGSGAFGQDATAFFVNTDPEWHRRGIRQAMTAAALRAAQDSGARRACLDRATLACRSTGGSGSRLSLGRRASSAPADRIASRSELSRPRRMVTLARSTRRCNLPRLPDRSYFIRQGGRSRP